MNFSIVKPEADKIGELDLKEASPQQGDRWSELVDIQFKIRKADPERTGLWLKTGKRLKDIIESEELMNAAGCRTKYEYLRTYMSRNGGHPSSCYKDLKAYETYQKHKRAFRFRDLDIPNNRESFIEENFFNNLLLLDKAILLKCSQPVESLGKQESSLASEESTERELLNEVFENFYDTYSGFRYFVYPEKEIEDSWKRKLKGWYKKIQAEFKPTGKIRLISYIPNNPMDKEQIEKIVLRVSKEIS